MDSLNIKEDVKWPIYDKKLLQDEDVNFVIQINGKKRDLLKIKKDAKENEVLKIIENNENLQKFLKNSKIKKIIFVKNRLINILLNEL